MQCVTQRQAVNYCFASVCGVWALAFAAAPLRADDPAPPDAAVWQEQACFSFGRRATAAAFSPDGKTLVVAGGADDDTGIVKLFDAATQTERLSLEGLDSWVNAVAFAPDGKTLATGAGGGPGRGEVKLWDVPTGRLLMSLNPEGGYVLSLAFSPDGKTLAVGSGHAENLRYFGQASFWDVASGRESTFSLQGAQGEVTALAYVNGGKQLASSGSRYDEASGREVWEVKLWDAADGKRQAVLFTSVGPEVDATFFQMRALAISADGKRIAGAGRDASQNEDRGTLRVWGVNPTSDSGFLSDETTPNLFSVAFAPDGRALAVGGVGDAIGFWDLTANRRRASQPSFSGAAFCVAFSPDGKQLIAGGVAIDNERRQSGIVQWWSRR